MGPPGTHSSLIGSRDRDLVTKANNFNLIRLVAASMVVFNHSFPLALGPPNADPLKALTGKDMGWVAVDVFFVISGMLIARSWCTSRSIISYAWARFLRIYPALVVACIACVAVIGPCFTSIDASQYWADPQILNFAVKNSTLLMGVSYWLPGVFTDLPYPGVVNGSLWTLPYEMLMYVAIPVLLCVASVLARVGRLLSVPVIALILALSLVAANAVNGLDSDGAPRQLLRLSSCFAAGSAFYFWLDRIRLCWKVFFGFSMALALSAASEGMFHVCYTLTLPYIVLFLGLVPKGPVLRFNALGDFSYGVYIYSFPIQQALVATLADLSPADLFLLAYPLTFIAAVLSWHLVEKPALSLKGWSKWLDSRAKQVLGRLIPWRT